MRALIGHTGFVGSNLSHQGAFDAVFNSKNFRSLAGRKFDEIWCAGVQAAKWFANEHPEEDWNGISALFDVLDTVEAERFVLISTIDVFRSPMAVDETTRPHYDGLHPYGLHRLRAEDRVRKLFTKHLIVRLPALYGEGLKKNVLYDFLHNNNLASIHADAIFQFYGVPRLTRDIDVAASAGLDLVHFTVEPVSVAELATHGFGITFQNRPTPDAPRYDMRTIHAGLWNREGPYLEDRAEVLRNIRSFVATSRQMERE